MSRLTLYYREGCSLCENMALELEPHREHYGFELDRVDIDADPELVRRFNERVPLLAAGETVLCEHFFDPARLAHYFTGP